MSERHHIHTQGLQHWSLLGKLHVSRKADMERGIKCCMPTTVHSGLNTLSNIFLTRFSRYCFSYQMLHLCSLVLEIRVDLAWKTMRFQMPHTLTALETQNLWDLLESSLKQAAISIYLKGSLMRNIISFLIFSVHISHWYRRLPTMKVPNYSLSTFSFSLHSTLKSHKHCTQYLKYRMTLFP